MNIKSIAIFDFLLKSFQKFIKFIMQSYLFITSEFIFILKQIFCLPKKPQSLLFQMVCLQISFQQIFSVNKLCGLLIIFPYPAVSHVFQGPGSSGSRFFRVRVQGPVPGSGSRVQGQGLGSGPRVRVQVLEVANIYQS